MTTTQQFSRLEQAIASIQERNGYCLVASESEADAHVVTVNDNFYATYCTCKSHGDCYHMVAVDRHYDSRRPSFSASWKPAKEVSQPVVTEAAKRVQAPINRRNEGFSLLRK